MADSIIQTGSFIADGKNVTLKIRSDVDKIVLENQTQWAAPNNGYGFRYTWYRDMGTTAMMEYHPAGDHTSAVNTTLAAISLVDSSDYALGTAVAVTAGTNVVGPVYSTANTAGLTTGSIVRLLGTDQANLNGLDFSIDTVVVNTSFDLANNIATAPGIIAGASGFYRLVAPNVETYSMFTPSFRNIADISQAASAVVTTLVDHGYAIGQRIKFKIPAAYGMIELDGLSGNITAISTSTFTVDINSTAFTAFKFPVYTTVPFDIAMAIPQGDGKSAVNQTAPSRFYNQGYIGLILTGGTTYPGGNAGDTVRWSAYKVD